MDEGRVRPCVRTIEKIVLNRVIKIESSNLTLSLGQTKA